jgi:hypothetical protein
MRAIRTGLFILAMIALAAWLTWRGVDGWIPFSL